MNLIDRAIARALRLRPMESTCDDETVCVVTCGFVNFFVCRRRDSMIAIDTGHSTHSAVRGLRTLGLDPARVSHVFLTHSDFDHAGGLGAFPDARVYLSEDEERLIAGKREVRLCGVWRNRIRKGPYTLLGDGETVRAGSFTVKTIKTPGHTVGSMCYLVDGALLFSGDMLSLHRGRAVPNRAFHMDAAALGRSFDRLTRLTGVKRLYTAHSGMATFREAMRDMEES